MTGATMIDLPFEGRDRIRIGLIGTGNRGSSLLGNLLVIDGAEVVAVCDPSPGRADAAADRVAAAGCSRAAVEPESAALIDRDDLDLVIIASPWELHTPLAVAAMRAGGDGVLGSATACWATCCTPRPPICMISGGR